MNQYRIPEMKRRNFIPQNLELDHWSDIQPYYNELVNREIDDVEALLQWLRDRSELESFVSENAGWRYIRMTCHTENKTYQDAFTHFITQIEPKIAPFNHQLNEKVLNNTHRNDLPPLGFKIMMRTLEKDFRIFREDNIPLNVEIQKLSTEYGTLSAGMTVKMDGEELTLQQAGVFLESADRQKREVAYLKISNRRYSERTALDKIFSELVRLRHQVAINANFENFRDYMFEALGRFDYKPKTCFEFHDSVREVMVPILNQLSHERKIQLKVDDLRPWDKAVDSSGLPPLKPFSSAAELTEKTIECFTRIHPFLGSCMELLQKEGRLDLESRKGKAPGGYNYPLPESGIPFIFMNATSTLRDLVTILHEGGHAVHSIITRDLELVDFQHTPSEVAELASMSMELLSMDHWDLFFPNREDLLRAKKQHLEQIIHTLPWIAVVDKFQHWVYENPNHSNEQRAHEWTRIFDLFADEITSWKELEQLKSYSWQKQLHLFEVPFYYIEYGIAQLGAIAIWKNFKEDREGGLESYLAALKAGYTRSIPEIYELAGISFDFSKTHLQDLILFVKSELDSLA